jgi:hypothetical protein
MVHTVVFPIKSSPIFWCDTLRAADPLHSCDQSVTLLFGVKRPFFFLNLCKATLLCKRSGCVMQCWARNREERTAVQHKVNLCAWQTCITKSARRNTVSIGSACGHIDDVYLCTADRTEGEEDKWKNAYHCVYCMLSCFEHVTKTLQNSKCVTSRKISSLRTISQTVTKTWSKSYSTWVAASPDTSSMGT